MIRFLVLFKIILFTSMICFGSNSSAGLWESTYNFFSGFGEENNYPEESPSVLSSMTKSEIYNSNIFKNNAQYCKYTNHGSPESCHDRLVDFLRQVGRGPATDSELYDVYGCEEGQRDYVCP